MNSRYFSALALTFPLFIAGCDNRNKQEGIVWVDYAQLLEKSAPGQQEKVRTAEVRNILLKADQNAREHYAALDKEKVDRFQAADMQALNNQWVLEQRQARQKTLDTLDKSISHYLTKKHLRAILPKEEAIAVAPEADVTQDIIDEVKDIKMDYGKLPEVTVKKEPATDAN